MKEVQTLFTHFAFNEYKYDFDASDKIL